MEENKNVKKSYFDIDSNGLSPSLTIDITSLFKRGAYPLNPCATSAGG